jgi:hypothetical protein
MQDTAKRNASKKASFFILIILSLHQKLSKMRIKAPAKDALIQIAD